MEILVGQEVDGRETDLLGRHAEIFESDFWVTPFAGGVADAAFKSRFVFRSA